LETKITKLLGIKYPIIQGAMAWVAEHSLASAVSNAGGLGIIAAANAPVEVVRNEIRKAKEITDKPFGVNIMLLSDNAEEVAHMVVEEKVPIVTTGAGNPAKYMKMWKENNIKVIPVVASTALAKIMERGGADAVIAEGCESGGHIGELTTMSLVPQVVDSVNIPVIAAGGIGDGRGALAAFALGAEALQLGTRFLVAKECVIHKNYKDKVLKAKDIDTQVTGRSTGHPVRILKNKMARQYLLMEKNNVPIEELENLGAGALRRAVVEGDVINGSAMAGQIAGLIKKEQTCKEIIDEIIEEVKQAKNIKRFI
jgi:enoyl-[acyl-carrier protein] reductase II